MAFNLCYRLLETAKDESVVRSQDLFTMVRYVSYNPVGQSIAWDWTTLNWDYLVNRWARQGPLPDRQRWQQKQSETFSKKAMRPQNK